MCHKSALFTTADLAVTLPGLCKYAYDTYSIVPVKNVDTRSSELNNIEAWMKAINHSKSAETNK